MVTIATFQEPAKANHLKQRLQESGLQADVNTESRLQPSALMSQTHANVTVKVHEADFDKAQKLVVEWEATDPEISAAIRCPQCRSPRIDYPQLAKKFPFIPGLVGILFALKIFPKEFYCQDCHFTWTKDGES